MCRTLRVSFFYRYVWDICVSALWVKILEGPIYIIRLFGPSESIDFIGIFSRFHPNKDASGKLQLGHCFGGKI